MNYKRYRNIKYRKERIDILFFLLKDYVYDKLWSELSPKDRQFLYVIAGSKTGKAKDIKDELKWANNQYTPYRDRLIKKMLVDGEEYGYLKITLPLFEDYVIRAYQSELD